MASSKLPPDQARSFRINILALMRMGHIGLTLLVVSGIVLIIPYANNLPDMPLLIVKLLLVVVLGALIGILSSTAGKLKAGDPSANPGRMQSLGRLSLLTSVAIVILAVLVFR